MSNSLMFPSRLSCIAMSKGLSLRREMFSSLDEKLRSEGKGDEDLRWPLAPREGSEDSRNEDTWDSDSDVDDWRDDYFKKLRELYADEGSMDASKFQEQFVDILPPH